MSTSARARRDRDDASGCEAAGASASGEAAGSNWSSGGPAARRRVGRRRVVAVLATLLLATAAAAIGAAAWARGGLGDRPSDTPATGATNPDLVVLVHGLGRSRFSMMPLEWALEAEGYRVFNWGYSSTCCDIEELADQLAEDLRGQAPGPGGELHFVGHSLGNIIVRSLLAEQPPPALGRVVMLAPPNQGSLAANRFLPILGWLYPPLAELTPSPTSTVRRVAMPESVEVGVIAGEHDGKVSVAESHLEGERDHAVVPSAHTFIMVREDVARLIVSFLERGVFPDA